MRSHLLSKDLEKLVSDRSRKSFSLQEFVDASGERAFGILLLLLALPSALPLPAAGISTPLGLAILLIAAQMIAGRNKIWMPSRVLKLKISASLARAMVGGLNKVIRILEVLVRPRLHWMGGRAGHIFVGVLISLLSIVMQIPIPLTNTLPAAVIFCLAICQTEEDGLFGGLASVLAIIVIVGYIAGFSAVVFFGFQGLGEVLDWIRSQF